MNYRQLSRLSHKEQNQGEVSANGTVTPATNRASSNVSMAVLDRYLSYGVWLLNDEQMAAHQMRLDREKRVSWARFLRPSFSIAAATVSFVHSFTRSLVHICTISERPVQLPSSIQRQYRTPPLPSFLNQQFKKKIIFNFGLIT